MQMTQEFKGLAKAFKDLTEEEKTKAIEDLKEESGGFAAMD